MAERELPDYHENKYPIHAFHRVLDAKMGSLADASDEYLTELRRQISIWEDEVRTEQAVRLAKAKLRDEARADEEDADDAAEPT